MGDGKDLDARCMASHIISRCYQIFTHRSLRDPDLRYIDIFERSIVNQVRFNISPSTPAMPSTKQISARTVQIYSVLWKLRKILQHYSKSDLKEPRKPILRSMRFLRHSLVERGTYTISKKT
jgi:hypothetical protein